MSARQAVTDAETRRAIRRRLVQLRDAGQGPERLLALAERFEARARRLADEARWVRQQIRCLYGPEEARRD